MKTQNMGDAVESDFALIDQKADAFEEAWRQGQRPRIEDHLGEWRASENGLAPGVADDRVATKAGRG